jgi:hypothetical protein
MRAAPKKLLMLIIFVFFASATPVAAAPTRSDDPTTAIPAVAALWVQLDGFARYQGNSPTWTLGPAIRAIATEPYQEAPGGARLVYYFDKARVEVNDPASADDGQLTLGLLVRDMISGSLQVGDQRFVPIAPADIPLAGDVTQNDIAPTYASLRAVATLGDAAAERRAPDRTGQLVTAALRRDGRVVPDAVPETSVRIAVYESTSGHNIPSVFWEALQHLPLPWLVLTGYPLTEPYWVQTRVAGAERLVLVQAFERRVLTYDPANPPAWQVEWGNVGLHYRLWRGLAASPDPEVQALASGMPFGEVLVSAARAARVDPYLLVALATVLTQNDPLAANSRGLGLLLVPRERLTGEPYPLDPSVNAHRAAPLLAQAIAQAGLEGGLAHYLAASGSSARPEEVLRTADYLRQRFPPGAPLPSGPALTEIGRGHAAFYDPSYDVSWWERTLAGYASWGGAVADAAPDPHGYYCVHPDFRPGQRLLLIANGRALWCTIGDTVTPGHVAAWRSRWVIELSWPTFVALGLDRNNEVIVWGPSE